MNVEIRTEAVQFLLWEYINGIFVTVCSLVQGEYNDPACHLSAGGTQQYWPGCAKHSLLL